MTGTSFEGARDHVFEVPPHNSKLLLGLLNEYGQAHSRPSLPIFGPSRVPISKAPRDLAWFWAIDR